MTLHKTLYPILAATLAAAMALISCEKSRTEDETPSSEEVPWQFALTRSGESGHTNNVATYRASLLHNGTHQLMADGSYCGFYTDEVYRDDWDAPKSWLYPCRTDGSGNALDAGGAIVPWDATNWFDDIDKDSKYALRGPKDLWVRFGIDYTVIYALVFASPAVRMESFTPDGGPAPTGAAANNPMNYHWGFPIARDDEWTVSPAVRGLPLNATYLNNQYVFSVNPELKDRHSKLTVKVACGALSEANIHSVYFENVLSTAYYMPMTETYEKSTVNWVFDGGVADPLTDYYTHNTYPASDGQPAGAGDKMVAPSSSPVHLVRKTGQTPDFVSEDQWQNFDQTADEWVKGDNTKCLLTAIRDFRLLSMDYSATEGDAYINEGFIPRLVIKTGSNGDIKTTIRIAENLEPMKAYTLYVWVSSAYVQAVLTVSPWTEIPEMEEDFDNDEATDFRPLVVSSWTTVPQNPDADGLIENPQE